MKRCRGLLLSLAGLMLMTTPAFAADYNFETPSPKDYYGRTSYEEVYGAQYNFGGINALDFLDPLADGAPVSSVGGIPTVEYGINAGNGSIYPDSNSDGYPIQWGDVSTLPITQFTSSSEVKRFDGSIGTLVIPSLGIRYKAYEGTDSAAMRNGVGHFPSTSAWGGNIGLVECGGRDMSLSQKDLTYTATPDLRERYHPGQALDCILKEYDRQTGQMWISVKDTLSNPFFGAIKRHPVGSRRQAVISGKYGGGVFCTLPDETVCLCLYSTRHLDSDFHIGDTVILVIKQFDYARHLIYGRILSKW